MTLYLIIEKHEATHIVYKMEAICSMSSGCLSSTTNETHAQIMT